MALMGFETDPIRRIGPRSLHGLIHDAAFVFFVTAFLAALFSPGRRFEADRRWRDHARYTLVTGILAVLLLLLPGVAYYLFIFTLLAWIESPRYTCGVPLSLGRLARHPLNSTEGDL